VRLKNSPLRQRAQVLDKYGFLPVPGKRLVAHILNCG